MTSAGLRNVLYAAPHCLLDTSSGAAISVRTLLEGLAAEGARVTALQASVFQHDTGAAAFLQGHPRVPPEETIRLRECAVEHLILRTASLRRDQMRAREEQLFIQGVLHELRSHPPDLVILWGNLLLERAVAQEARLLGMPVAFYLVSAGYSQRDLAIADVLITDSAATAILYRQLHGVEAKVVGKFIDRKRVVASKGTRRYVTMINPTLAKGAGLLVALALAARSSAPDLRFLVVEGRAEWPDTLRRFGLAPDATPNVTVMRHSEDMRPVYAATKVLLTPTIGYESGARVIAEALLNGIPVLVTDNGGSAELLGDSGFVFPIPPSLKANQGSLPSEEELKPWLQILCRLSFEPEFYQAEAMRAIAAGDAHSMNRSLERFTQALAPFLNAAGG